MSELVERYDSSSLEGFAQEILRAAGVPRPNCAIVARSLIRANLRGVDTHGISWIPIIVRKIRSGLIDPVTSGEFIRETHGTALLDGRNGLGQVIGTVAMSKAIAMASQIGISAVGVCRVNHFGAAAYYSMMALEHDMIGIVFTNSPTTMAVWGAARPYLGTNPLSFAFPAGREFPIVVDMATSVWARQKLYLAARRGERIPLGIALGTDGRPTDDPSEALKGTMLPFGAHKGSALALAVECLGGILTGSPFGPHIAIHTEPPQPTNVGNLFIAIKVGAFVPIDEFKARMDQMISEIRALPPAEGHQRVILPGEQEFLNERDRLREGIPLPQSLVEELTELGSTFGVAMPEPKGVGRLG